MTDVKCKNCNRLLMKASVVVAAVKCPRCGKIFEYKVVSSLHLTNAYDTSQLETTESSPSTG
jgi:phage FluMu protein Com